MHEPAPAAKPRVTVDEQVVRRMLAVNPAIRQGRTTGQIKRSLERGEPLGAQAVSAEPESRSDNALGDALAFFLRGKADALSKTAADIEAKKRALDAELESAKRAAREQVAQFVALLDASGRTHVSLAQHADPLRTLGLTPSQLVAPRSVR